MTPETMPTITPATDPRPLYVHVLHAHRPHNVNETLRSVHATAGVNTRIAVWLTRNVGTMACAYLFLGIGLGSLIGVFTGNALLAAIFGSLSSYVLQLVLLPILSVGQNVLSRHQEAQADEVYQSTLHTLHDSEQMIAHLDAQDTELQRQTAILVQLLEAHTAPLPVHQRLPLPKGKVRRLPRHLLTEDTPISDADLSADEPGVNDLSDLSDDLL